MENPKTKLLIRKQKDEVTSTQTLISNLKAGRLKLSHLRESFPYLQHDRPRHSPNSITKDTRSPLYVCHFFNYTRWQGNGCWSLRKRLSNSCSALCWTADLCKVTKLLDKHPIIEQAPILSEGCHKPA